MSMYDDNYTNEDAFNLNLNKKSIATSLLSVAGIGLISLLATSSLAIFSSNYGEERLNSINRTYFRRLALTEDFESNSLIYHQNITEFKYNKAKGKQTDEILENLTILKKAINETLYSLEGLMASDVEKVNLHIKTAEISKEYLTATEKFITNEYEGISEEELLKTIDNLYKQTLELSGKITDLTQDDLIKTIEESEAKFKIYTNATKYISAITKLSCIIVTFVVLKGLKRKVKNTMSILDTLANNDYSNRIIVDEDSNHELDIILRHISDVQLTVRETLMDINIKFDNLQSKNKSIINSSNDSRNTTSEISDAIHDIAYGVNEQAHSLQDIVNKLNQFQENLVKNNEDISNINKESALIGEKVEDSNKELMLLDKSINEIGESFDVLDNQINQLLSNVSQITEITTHINNIAAQTNMLSLNASIEAARAGENGRGFAVVADEVRKLAEQSKTYASRITKILDTVNSQSELTLKTTDMAKSALKEGAAITNKTINTLTNVFGDVRNTIDKFEVINEAIDGITKSTSEIFESINVISGISQENLANSEEISASTIVMVEKTQDVNAICEDSIALGEEVQLSIEKFRL